MKKPLELDDFLLAAKNNDWGVVDHGTNFSGIRNVTFIGPRFELCEPHKIDVVADPETGIISSERNTNFIHTDINAGRGLKAYAITAAAALKTIANTYHPLRANIFFQRSTRKHKDMCEPNGINQQKIRLPAMRGYFPSIEADKLSIIIYNCHPAEVWGGKAWIEAAVNGWP